MRNLVSTEWLEKNLDKVRIFDGSWHLPASNRNAEHEFKSAHIKNSVFVGIKAGPLDSQFDVPFFEEWVSRIFENSNQRILVICDDAKKHQIIVLKRL